MRARFSYVIDISWHFDTDLPTRVGPFTTPAEAIRWGRQNIPNGTWEIWPVTYPYYLGADS